MITLFYAGSLTLLAIVLATLTGRRRIKSEINLDWEKILECCKYRELMEIS